ncbi:envelope stress response membrane protein PspB [Saccharophagus sp. K07]|jgi:phage shock protein B|uniref:envelope stress response membrane protein PspB n=1 Tax=Saccharophagus sp. K07 TaxID=2283636 RepID=UPI0016525EB3|nr:envelope stress response membrane protein PspB [Saccharophagus sp. K07]MBC6905482.1 envelope stress response membrane protein PspB [Saccharophagus sp. K07]
MVGVAQGIMALSFALCLLIIPLWLMTRIFGRGRCSRGTSEEERNKIERLLQIAETMEKRLVTLEAILDKQHPNWRHDL